MKKLSLLTIGLGSASLLMAGAAMAAPPTGFTYNDYTVSVGNITPGACPSGYTCQTLQSDVGFLQQRVSDGTAAGTFFRTIIVEDDASAGDPGQVDGLAFRNDTFVGATNNSGNLAGLGKVELEGAIGSGTSTASLAFGDLKGPGEAAIRFDQVNDMVDRSTTLTFEDAEGDGASVRLRMDQINPVGGNFSGPMTVRRTTGSYTVCSEPGGVGCVLELPDGQTITYDSGNNIAVMYQHQALFSMGPAPVAAASRVFENQRFTVGANSITWTNASNNMNPDGTVNAPGGMLPNGGGPIGGVTFSTVNADGGAWDYWDANFGTAPTGVTPPATFPGTPFQP